MRLTRHRHLSRGAASLDAALVGAGPEVATPPLARLGRQLQAARLGPDASFRRELRSQLLGAATVTAPAPTRGRPLAVTSGGHSLGWFATRLTAGIAAAGVMVTGVGVASARALPGDALYGIKRDTESLQLRLAHGESAQGLLHLQFAASRLSEVHALLNRAGLTAPKNAKLRSPAAVPKALAATLSSTLSAMNADTSSGASELTQSFLRKRQEASLTKLAAFTTQQETALTSVLPALPAPEAAVSLHVLHAVAAQTTALLAEPASAPPVLPPASPTPAPSSPPSPVASSPTPTPSTAPTPTSSSSPSPTPSVAPSSPTPTPTSTPSPTGEPKSPDGSPAGSPTPTSDPQSPTPAPSTSTPPASATSTASPSASATVTP